MKFFTLIAGIAAADQFINLHMAPPYDYLGYPVRNEFQLMELYGLDADIINSQVPYPELMALAQMEEEALELQMLSQELAFHGVELQNLDLSEIIALQNLGGSCASATSLIKSGEGLRTKMYYDTMGIPTVCYGYNLKNGNARSQVSKAGGSYDAIMKGQATSQSVCNKLLDFEIAQAKKDKQALFGNLKCSAANDVAIDMTYNMGKGTMSQFKKFIAAMKAGKWQEAKKEGQNSAWCRQVGGRCSRNMNQIVNCCK